MKKILIVLLVLLSGISLIAETPKKIIEVGLTTARPLYDSYNFTFKFGDENSVYRLSSLSLSEYIRHDDRTDVRDDDTLFSTLNDNSTSFGLAFGREIRKEIDQNFEFRYGLDLTLAYSIRNYISINDTVSTMSRKEIDFSPGFKFVLGFNYVLKDKIVFGVEFLPRLYYSYSKDVYEGEYNSSTTNYRADINYMHYWKFQISTAALFSISYRF